VFLGARCSRAQGAVRWRRGAARGAAALGPFAAARPCSCSPIAATSALERRDLGLDADGGRLERLAAATARDAPRAPAPRADPRPTLFVSATAPSCRAALRAARRASSGGAATPLERAGARSRARASPRGPRRGRRRGLARSGVAPVKRPPRRRGVTRVSRFFASRCG
jgi:hypothetical protein